MQVGLRGGQVGLHGDALLQQNLGEAQLLKGVPLPVLVLLLRQRLVLAEGSHHRTRHG